MEQEPSEQSASKNETRRDVRASQGDVVSAPPSGSETFCPTCAGAVTSTPISYVYAIGRVEARFPNLAAEKEFA
jgi:hypothetical protein